MSHYPKEGPWELPEGWVWTTLDKVCSIRGGKRIPKGKTFAKERTAHVYIRVTDMKNMTVDTCGLKYIDDEVFDEINSYIIEKDDLYLTIAGTIGKVGTIPEELHGMNLTENAARLTDIVCDKLYLMYALQTDVAQTHFSLRFHQVAQPKLSIETASSTPIALPPLPEQKRIVSVIETLLTCIHTIEEEQQELETNTEKTKSRILDLAIHGKLVPQDPTEEPAIELLMRTNSDFTPSDNLHYDGVLPMGWSLTRLGDVIDIFSGTSYQKADIVQVESGIRILRGGNIQNGKIILCDDDVYVQERLSARHLSLCRGDIALVASTGSSELIGKAAMAERDYPNTQIGAFLRIIRPKAIELAEYLGVIFQSNYYKNHIRDVAKGTNINNIKSVYITEFVVPIPPIEEQRRILYQIKTLFTITSQITNSIDETK